MAILHRKNALFFKTQNAARVGDMYMSLIHTCELCQANRFDYLTELLRHSDEAAAHPDRWMQWDYRATLDALQPAAAPPRWLSNCPHTGREKFCRLAGRTRRTIPHGGAERELRPIQTTAPALERAGGATI